MSDFSAACPDAVTLDPTQRVCYSNGLVLGVDEFLQEELYLLEKDRLHNRALHGYGTICGLRITAEDAGDAGPQVVVTPGLAVDPAGREIRVPKKQCGRLDEWLLRHPEAADLAFGSPRSLALYVVLCHRECKTDEVPIPGGPCRTPEDSTAPSRIADAFELVLRTEPPEQIEEEAIRAFGDLLADIAITSDPTGTVDAEAMADLVRGLLAGSPPGLQPPAPASPPGIPILAEEAEDAIRAAFRVWVTEVRPSLLPDGRGCASGPPREDCVLVARIDFPVRQVGEVLQVDGDATAVTVDETERPYLLQTRMLQECCIVEAGTGSGAGGGGNVVDPASRALVADLDAGGSGEERLTRIFALNWSHGARQNAFPRLVLGDQEVSAIAIGFGIEELGDAQVRVERGSVDAFSFQVFAEQTIGRIAVQPFRIVPRAVVPLTGLVLNGDLIERAVRSTNPAQGAALIFDTDLLTSALEGSNGNLSVVLRGDPVRDRGGRAIDAELVRSQLPTGDRAAGADRGIQGGRFESWFRLPAVVDLNSAPFDDLVALPGLSEAIARRIVDRRPFASVDDLLEVDGIAARRLDAIRNLVTIREAP